MHAVVPALLVSALSGLYTSAWGAYKDGPYEGFNALTFPRSVFFSIGIALFLMYGPFEIGPAFAQLPLFHVFLVIMGIERMITEIYKACFRHSDQSKFLIPQRMTLFGRSVDSEIARVATGIVLTAGVLVIPFWMRPVAGLPTFVSVAFLTGMFICSGGAYKDAPFEGFSPKKFFRSAIVLSLVSPLIYWLGSIPMGFLIYTFGGLERLLVEYYKSYVMHSVPGKFRPDLPRIEDRFFHNRGKLHLVAIALMLLLAGLYAQALLAKLG